MQRSVILYLQMTTNTLVLMYSLAIIYRLVTTFFTGRGGQNMPIKAAKYESRNHRQLDEKKYLLLTNVKLS